MVNQMTVITGEIAFWHLANARFLKRGMHTLVAGTTVYLHFDANQHTVIYFVLYNPNHL